MSPPPPPSPHTIHGTPPPPYSAHNLPPNMPTHQPHSRRPTTTPRPTTPPPPPVAWPPNDSRALLSTSPLRPPHPRPPHSGYPTTPPRPATRAPLVAWMPNDSRALLSTSTIILLPSSRTRTFHSDRRYHRRRPGLQPPSPAPRPSSAPSPSHPSKHASFDKPPPRYSTIFASTSGLQPHAESSACTPAHAEAASFRPSANSPLIHSARSASPSSPALPSSAHEPSAQGHRPSTNPFRRPLPVSAPPDAPPSPGSI